MTGLIFQTASVYALAPIINPQAVSIPEDSTNGTQTNPAKVTAIDPENGALTYEITGERCFLFDVNPTTGILTFSGNLGDLDYETTKSYTLTVKVTDVEPTSKQFRDRHGQCNGCF
ncbi:MAG: cadherin repeat domain-containing protein [Chloroflexota bacterium]